MRLRCCRIALLALLGAALLPLGRGLSDARGYPRLDAPDVAGRMPAMIGAGEDARGIPLNGIAFPDWLLSLHQGTSGLPTPPASPSPCGANLLANAGFEAGLEGWYVEGAAAVEEATGPPGGHVIRLGSGSADAFADQFVPAVRPGTVYRLTGWGRLNASGERAELGVVFRDVDGNRLNGEEPAPLIFDGTDFAPQSLAFRPSPRVAAVAVYLYKSAGSAQFYAGALSLSACESVATATPEPVPTRASPPPLNLPATPVAGPALTTYVDQAAGFTIGYPSGWTLLTEGEIRRQVGELGDGATGAVLASVSFVAVSPDGRTALALSQVPLPRQAPPELDDIAERLQAALAVGVAGYGNSVIERTDLDGVDAVELAYSATAAGPPQGTANGTRSVRQIVTVVGSEAIVVTLLSTDADPVLLQETFQWIKDSWRWST